MPTLPHDWREFFELVLSTKVHFVIVGGLAVAVHAEPRFTEDLDVFVRPSLANARRLRLALQRFGFGDGAPSVESLAEPDTVRMIGRKPLRIDILTGIDGVTFRDAWAGRVEVVVDGLSLPFIGLEQLIQNKTASGRDKDRADLASLAKHARRP